jgi:hypothetical protein
MKRDTLKKHFFNEGFSQLVTSMGDQEFDEGSRVFIKRLEEISDAKVAGKSLGNIGGNGDEEEEGEIGGEKLMRVFYRECDKKEKLREILDGTVVHEYPTLYVLLQGTVKE